jgi:hypothetical protein
MYEVKMQGNQGTRFMKKPLALCLLYVCVLSGQANGLSFKDYKIDKVGGGHRWEEFKIYITGVGEGLQWANTELVNQGKPPIFCQPEHFTLRTENLLDALNKILTKIRWPDDNPIEPALLRGLQEAFPCASSG